MQMHMHVHMRILPRGRRPRTHMRVCVAGTYISMRGWHIHIYDALPGGEEPRRRLAHPLRRAPHAAALPPRRADGTRGRPRRHGRGRRAGAHVVKHHVAGRGDRPIEGLFWGSPADAARAAVAAVAWAAYDICISIAVA